MKSWKLVASSVPGMGQKGCYTTGPFLTFDNEYREMSWRKKECSLKLVSWTQLALEE